MEKSDEQVPALVFGGGITGLGVVRNLGRNGVPVYCIVERPDQAIYSKFCKKCFVVPNIEKNTSILRRFFLDTAKLPSSGVLFPTSDLYSLRLSELRDELGYDYHPLVPSKTVVETLVEKKMLYRSLSVYKVPHPATFFPTTIGDVEELSIELEYPVLVKPSRSQAFWEAFMKKGFKANSAKDLIHYYNLVSRRGIDVVIQEVIPGTDKNMYSIAGYFDEYHIPKALFAYHRLRGYPPVFGTSSLIESIPLSRVNSMKEIIEGYLHRLQYYGIMEAEFKLDPRDGAFKLIEINARSWWQNSLPTKCGINIVLVAYLDALGKETRYIEDYDEGIRWINFLNDVASVVETRPSVGEWVRSIKKIRDWAYFAADDLIPWIRSNCLTVREIAKMFYTHTKYKKG